MGTRGDEQDLGEILIQGLREAIAIERGAMEPARISRHPLGAREAEASPPEHRAGETGAGNHVPS